MGPWIFATAALVSVIVLSVNYSTFRKTVLIGTAGLVALIAGAVFVSNWLDERASTIKKSKIKTKQISTERLLLSLPTQNSEFGHLSGEISNDSVHKVDRINYKLIIMKCTAPKTGCSSIYTKEESVFVDIPSKETRKIDELILLSSLPLLENWTWGIVVTEVWAD